MTRFLTIFKKTSYLPKDFMEDILGLREFLLNEYKFVEKYPLLYNHMDRRTLPKKPMHPNSVTPTLRVLSTFFNELENNDEILKSPFRRLSKTRRQNILSEHYDEPYSLTREEFMTIMNSEVPDDMKEVKDAFLLQCALGCRISDFMRMDMSNVSVSDEGIPYVHYVAKKTTNTSSGRKEKTTPLMLFVLDIIKRYDFRFPMFYNCTYGKCSRFFASRSISRSIRLTRI